MVLRKNLLRNIFLAVIAICVSFNASNTNILVQLSSIYFIFFFFLCLKNNEVSQNIKENYSNNKVFFILLFIYLIYLIIQIIPLPLIFFKIISPLNYELYSSIRIDKNFWSLSLNPSNSYFKILNVINFFIIFLIFPALFYRSKHLMRLLFFLCLLGFCHAVFATYWMLIGNPSNFLIEKIHYLNSSTGLFVNRAVFATFLLLCAFSGLYYMTLFFQKNKITSMDIFEQIKSNIIYLRIFIIFITIGILTTWSRIANFSYILILLSFLMYSKISFKKFINPLSTIILFILFFDFLILGIFFGNEKLLERYIQTSVISETIRINIQEFALLQFKNFWLFGYGSGAFETAYKIFYDAPQGREIALHAHNDWIELLGEIGAIGSFIFLLILITYFKKIKQNINQSREFLRFFFIISLLTIIFVQSFFDYSLHIPGISILIVVILSIGLVDFKNKNT